MAEKRQISDFLYEKESYAIRGACFAVWKQFGGAFKETVIQRALGLEFSKRQLRVESQKRINLFYDQKMVGTYIPDFVVNEEILIELKAKPFVIKEDERQF